jgi:hypothetical protein
MKWAVIGASALVLAAAGAAQAGAADAITPGRWEFTAQLQAAAPAAGGQTPAAAKARGGGAKATYTSCIAADRAVPTELGPQCKIDSSKRHGGRLTWSMTCTNPQNSVHSDGEAQYHGDAMEATMTSHLPGADGTTTDMSQHITGRYLGPCLQAADMPMTPSHPTAPPEGAAARPEPEDKAADKAAAPAAPEPPAATPDSTAKTETAPPPRRHASHRYAGRRGYAYQSYYAGAGIAGVPYDRGFGPAPYSSSGP